MCFGGYGTQNVVDSRGDSALLSPINLPISSLVTRNSMTDKGG